MCLLCVLTSFLPCISPLACGTKLSSEDAVRRVLAGEKADVRGRGSRTSRSHESDNKTVREDDPRARRDREVSCQSHVVENEAVPL